MLFEREQLSPLGRIQVIEAIFSKMARRPNTDGEPGRVPLEILEAYGDFNAHTRFILEATACQPGDRERHRQLRKIERELDALPACIMETLPAGPTENWLGFYRRLIHLHEMLEELHLDLDAEEYSSLIQKMVQLADSVSRAGAVEVNAASMFTLLLIQVHLHRREDARSRKPRKKTRKRKAAPARRRSA